ncbi:MAG: hypothetical protein ACKE51_05765 [Methylococcaceae bacterium]
MEIHKNKIAQPGKHFQAHLIKQKPFSLLIRSGAPRTNGMIKHFNEHLADVLITTRFDLFELPVHIISRYVYIYKQSTPQKALGQMTPI